MSLLRPLQWKLVDRRPVPVDDTLEWSCGSSRRRSNPDRTQNRRMLKPREYAVLWRKSLYRIQRLGGVLRPIIICLIWLSAGLIAAALMVAAFHHLTAWGWLTELQLAVLDTFLFSGALVIVTKNAK